MLSVIVPLVILLGFTYKTFQESFGSPYRVVDGKYYVICPTVNGCNTYVKSDIDHPGNPSYFLNPLTNFQNDLVSVKSQQSAEKQIFYFLCVLSAGLIAVGMVVWTRNSIAIKDNVITINSLLSSGRPQFGLKPYRWKTTKRASIPLESITGIKVVTTTPLIPNRTDVSQVNWRDVIYLSYNQANSVPSTAAIEFFIFPGFKKILRDLISQNPKLPISFTKESTVEKLQDVGLT